jgi:hypothetical protein
LDGVVKGGVVVVVVVVVVNIGGGDKRRTDGLDDGTCHVTLTAGTVPC